MFKMNNRNEFIRLLSFMRPRILTYTIGLIGSNTLNAGISIIMAFVFKGMIDAAIKGNITLLIHTAILALVSTILFNILLPFTRYLLDSSIQKTSKDIQMKVFDHLEKLPVSYFEKSHSGDIHSRVNHDTNDMQGAFAQHLNATIASLITGIGSAAVLFIVEWRLGIIVIILGIASLFVNKRFAPAFRYMNSMKNKHYGKLSECMVDILSGFNIMKIFNIENIVEKRFSEYNDEATKMAIGRGQKHALMSCANALMSYLSFVIVIAVGSFMVMLHMVTFGTVIAVTQLLGNVTSMFLDVGGNYALVQRSLASAVRVFEFLDNPEENENFSVPQLYDKPVNSYIEMKDVSFGYGDNAAVLSGLNLKVEQGQMAALVGPSGGGKSTIIKLLMCYYPWKTGEITLAGRPVQDFSIEEIRQMIAYVPQEPYLFDTSIEDNIRYGKIGATTEEIINAAKAANAHDFIIAQKDGYKTLVGERGVRLSGGQKQRIAIARALLKNAPILLLDEATSSLDSENEQLVQSALNVLMKDRTTLVVAHRLSTIEKADVIYVVNKGCIQEYGEHNKLLEANGIYKTLYELQYKNEGFAAVI